MRSLAEASIILVTLSILFCGCQNPSTSSDGASSGKVTIGSQSGIIFSGICGTATFSVATADIASGTAGTIAWYASSEGATPASAPTGITATVTSIVDNSATITMTGDAATLTGSYYFKLSEGSYSSSVGTAVVITGYAIRYDANGGSGTMACEVFQSGKIATLSANGFIAPSGFVFAGWTTNARGAGASYADKMTITMGTADILLYAVWLPSTLKFFSYGNGISVAGYSTAPAGALTLPCGVTSIATGAFLNCGGLTGITIPSSVTSIGNLAFGNCSGLTSVTLPSSVAWISEDAFGNCSALTSITVAPDNPNYCSDASGVLYDKAQTTLVEAPGKISGSYSIPSSVTSIGIWAFDGCSGLTSITIPSSVASIGSNAFWGCSGLASITIPSSVTLIGNAVFGFCSGLTSITIPSSVTSIGWYEFEGCTSLANVTIPSSVTSIGPEAFSNCTSLANVHEQATIPPHLPSGSDAFLCAPSGFIIYVPSAELETYKIATGWSDYASHIQGE